MRWLPILRRSNWDSIRAREIENYLELETADNIARGMTPDQAAASARRKLGNTTLIREEIYHMNSISWLESIGQDIRYGARLLILNPGFALVGILSLALGIGANTAIFQLLNAVRLRSLPVANPQELAEVKIVGGNNGLGTNDDYGELTQPIWEELRRNHPVFSSAFAWRMNSEFVGKGSTRELVNSLYVTGDAFTTLGIQPSQGRLITPNDDQTCPGTVAAVSYPYWQAKLGGRPTDGNTKLWVDNHWVQIVGVTPPSFFGLIVGQSFDIVQPLCKPREMARNAFNVAVVGRLRPGWTLASASAQLAAMSPGVMAATEILGYDSNTVQTYRRFRLGAYPASSGVSYLRDAYDSSLQMLLGITGLVLLIACANLANLMLARASARAREIAVRLALGAARTRLLRQLLVESTLLGLLGALLGVALAKWLSQALILSLATEIDSVKLSTPIDWRVLLFTAALTVLTCVIFGLVPSFRASCIDPVVAMKAGARGITANRERFSFQRGMVVTQIAVSLILLVGAGLFVRSFYNLMTFDPGMREAGVVHGFLRVPNSNLSPEHLEEFKRELLDEVRSVPGVQTAAATSFVPLVGGSWGHTITIGKIEEGHSRFSWVSPGYFETMEIPLQSGRNFTQNDTSASQPVAIVNQTFVRNFLKDLNPLGQTIRTHPEPNYPATIYQIVGVIPDTKYNDLRGETPPMLFAPYAQFPDQRPWMHMMIHSTLPPSILAQSVNRRIAAKHPAVIADFRGFEQQIHDGLVRERLMALLSGFFGLLAAVLGMVGLYGVMSYIIGQRRNEIGIRLALGASRGQVVAMVMREVGVLLVVGIAIGTVLALLFSRWASTLLFGLTPSDPITLLSATALLALVGVVAGFLPTLSGSRVDAMTALRCE
jgi:predicted permease